MDMKEFRVYGDLNNYGLINLGEISGSVAVEINRLPNKDFSGNNTSELKCHLDTLKTAIMSELNLPDAVKVNALREVGSLAKSVQIKDEGQRKQQASMALSALKALSDSLASIAKLAGSLKTLLPLIGSFFGLV